MWPLILLFGAGCGPTPTPCMDDVPAPAEPRAAGCMVISEGGLLLVRTQGGWSIPGGHREAGETSAAAAARETREESGVDVRAGAVACVVPATGFVAHWCVPTLEATPPTPDGVESSAARYVGSDELSRWDLGRFRFPDQVPAYLRALDPKPAHGSDHQIAVPAPPD